MRKEHYRRARKSIQHHLPRRTLLTSGHPKKGQKNGALREKPELHGTAPLNSTEAPLKSSRDSEGRGGSGRFIMRAGGFWKGMVKKVGGLGTWASHASATGPFPYGSVNAHLTMPL